MNYLVQRILYYALGTDRFQLGYYIPDSSFIDDHFKGKPS